MLTVHDYSTCFLKVKGNYGHTANTCDAIRIRKSYLNKTK